MWQVQYLYKGPHKAGYGRPTRDMRYCTSHLHGYTKFYGTSTRGCEAATRTYMAARKGVRQLTRALYN